MAEEFKTTESEAQIAYRLFLHIAEVEKKGLSHNNLKGYEIADRKWILDTFYDTMKIVRRA